MQASYSYGGEKHSPLCREGARGHDLNKKCTDKSWKAKVINLFYFYSFSFTVFLFKNDFLQVVKRLILSHPQMLGEEDC